VLSEYLSVVNGAVRPENHSGDPSIPSFRARGLRSALYSLMARYEEAEHDARFVIAVQRGYGEGWLLLGDSVIAQGKESEFEGVLKELDTVAGGDVPQALLRASRYSREGNRRLGLDVLDAALFEHPGNAFLERARARLACAERHGPLCTAYFLSAAMLPVEGSAS
jgi:hypothetical protein